MTKRSDSGKQNSMKLMKMVSGHEEELLGLIERLIAIGPEMNIIIAMIQEYRNMNTIKTRYKIQKEEGSTGLISGNHKFVREQDRLPSKPRRWRRRRKMIFLPFNL